MDHSPMLLAANSSAESPPPLDPRLLHAVRELSQGRSVEESSRLLFEAYQPRVRAFLRSRGASPSDAEELTQEVFIRVFNRLEALRCAEKFEGWLFSIAAKVFTNKHRERSRRSQRINELAERYDHQQDPADRWVHSLSQADQPDLQVLAEERRREDALSLARALDALPEQMRRSIVGRLAGRPFGELANELESSSGAIRSQVSQGCQRLRLRIADRSGGLAS